MFQNLSLVGIESPTLKKAFQFISTCLMVVEDVEINKNAMNKLFVLKSKEELFTDKVLKMNSSSIFQK